MLRCWWFYERFALVTEIRRTSSNGLSMSNEPENEVEFVSETICLSIRWTHDLPFLDNLENKLHNEVTEIGNHLLGDRVITIPHTN